MSYLKGVSSLASLHYHVEKIDHKTSFPLNSLKLYFATNIDKNRPQNNSSCCYSLTSN